MSQSVDSFKTVKAPFVHVGSLTSFVVDLITKYDQNGKQNCDHGIPDDEIWVKVGGDHGGGSFKLAVQVCNLNNPNSRLDMIAFTCCKAKDYYQNLKDICSYFASDINSLSQVTWNDKKIKVFLYGDYAFLCNMCGLSGARGTYFCLWCTQSAADRQIPLKLRGETSLTTLSHTEK